MKTRALCLTLALVSAVACSTAAVPDGTTGADAADGALLFGDTAVDAAGKGSDAVADSLADAVADGVADVPADVPADVTLVQTCPGAPGCSCASAADCDFAFCLDTPDGKRCATPCTTETCPTGQKCGLVTFGGDPTYACVQKWGKLCYPCAATKDCAEPGITGSLCVDEGPQGSFCGAACTVTADCPDGYACQVGQSPEGPKALQCVRVAADGKSPGTCSCTPAAKALALATPCYAEQTDLSGKVVGKCPGTRMCGPTGLGACTLVALKPEVCDGIDNDCNGTIDDQASGCDPGASCVSGKCMAACTPVDGGWSPWLAGTCSAQCGGGTLVSTRTCDAPAPSCGGAACVGDAQKSESCNPQACTGNTLPAGTTTYGTGGQIVQGLVPAGKTSLLLFIWGGGGGGGFPGTGGGAAFGQVSVPVTAGDAIELRVAEGGAMNGGGGASYVLRNGQVVVVIGGGGGAGYDGCSGCSGAAAVGGGGGGGAIGGAAVDGTANGYVSTNSGGGGGGSATAGGVGGKQGNVSSYTGCTEDGAAGSANTGGAGIGGFVCAAPSGACTASYQKAGTGCPTNGGSGGGGAGWYGGGSGAAMYTYTGGGGGGGSSWIAADVTKLTSNPGGLGSPGGVYMASWQGQAGSGGTGVQGAFLGNPQPGRPGQITLTL